MTSGLHDAAAWTASACHSHGVESRHAESSYVGLFVSQISKKNATVK